MTSNEKNNPDSLLTESGKERKENTFSLDDEINFFEKTAKQNEYTLLEWAKVGADFGDGIVAIRQKITECRQLADWLKELKSYREHNSIPASSENRVKLEHIECEDAVSRSEILSYIDRIQSQGTGKHKSFEFIQKYVEKMPSVKPKLPKCEDTVSRTDVFNAIRGEERGGYVDVTVEYMLEVMSNLPSVKPDVTHCGDCENSDC